MRRTADRARRGATLVTALAAALVAILAAPTAAAQREVPYLSGRVVDEAGIVPDDAEARIEQRLAAWEAETGNQVAVLTVGSLEGDAIEDFSMRVAETWKIGRGGVDDGVIFVVASDDRRMRIEVGYGLEAELTDLESGRILDEIVGPRFRQGDFGGGVEAGVEAIVAGVEGAELPEPPADAAAGRGSLVTRLVGFGIFAVVIGSLSLAALATPGGPGWFLYVFLLPFYVIFPVAIIHPRAGPIAGLLWLVLFPILRVVLRKRGWRPRFVDESGSRRYRRGGWGGGGGGFFGGGFGGGGFGGGGGGFSGGGGSFGGGGASGSW